MKIRRLIPITLFLISPMLLFGQTSSTRIPLSRLKSIPFTAGPLKLTFMSLIGRNGAISYRGVIEIEVENLSDGFATFEPRHLSIVDTNENQVDVLGSEQNSSAFVYPATSRRIAPKARIKCEYVLTDRFEMPVAIYYEDKLLAFID